MRARNSGVLHGGCAGLLALAFGAAQAHGPHQHGVADLDVVSDGGALQIELSTPAANLFGFEYAPRNAREEAVLRDGFAALEQGAGLFAPAADARCTFGEVTLLSSLLSPDQDDGDHPAHGNHGHDDHDRDDRAHAHGDDDGHDEHDDGEHADVFVSWTLSCEAPEALRSLDAGGLFRRFPGIETLRVHAAAAQGQTAATLNARNTVARF